MKGETNASKKSSHWSIYLLGIFAFIGYLLAFIFGTSLYELNNN